MLIDKLGRYRAERNRREGFNANALSTAEADRLMSELLSHTMEELLELRLCVNRKAWKPMPSLRTPEGAEYRAHALEELADVLLMLNAFTDVAGITMQEVQDAVLAKMQKNLSRPDHLGNK